jgi:hypothetical protein
MQIWQTRIRRQHDMLLQGCDPDLPHIRNHHAMQTETEWSIHSDVVFFTKNMNRVLPTTSESNISTARWPCYHGEPREQRRGTRKLPNPTESKKKDTRCHRKPRRWTRGLVCTLAREPATSIQAEPGQLPVGCKNFFGCISKGELNLTALVLKFRDI